MSTDAQTPGRRASARSNLASHDLARRLSRLPVPREAIPRLTQFVLDELDEALRAHDRAGFGEDEIEAAGGSADLLDTLRKNRADAERIEAIRAAGLADLGPSDLEAVLEAAK